MKTKDWLVFDGTGELVNGLLVAEKTATPECIAIVQYLVDQLQRWALPRQASVCGQGHKLAVSETNGRKTDICVYTLVTQSSTRAIDTATIPALVVEVTSVRPVDLRRARLEALADYHALGVPIYWIVSPAERLFECFVSNAEPRYALHFCGSEGIAYQTGLLGIALDLDALWAVTTAVDL